MSATDNRLSQKLDRSDRPSVVAPGPVIMTLTVALGCGLDQIWRIGILADMDDRWRVAIGFVSLALGLALILIAGSVFHRVGTPFLPWMPARALATGGLYSRTRNPMYQGLVPVAAGAAILLQSDWGLLLLAPAAAVLHFGVVLREERYLKRKFGAAYRAYMHAVPRYGWPFARSRPNSSSRSPP